MLPVKNHYLKKLVLLFYEVIQLKGNDIFLLIVDNLRRDLIHPNEYVRGSTMRFLSKLDNPSLIESLIEPIKDNLNHKVSYVRRNAVLAISRIYSQFPDLIRDAEELIFEFIQKEEEHKTRSLWSSKRRQDNFSK